MHIQWNIQLRFDPLGDEDKKKEVTATVMRTAAHLLAVANTLEGPVKSTIACYSDDFMKGREQIALIPDTISSALKAFNNDQIDPPQDGLSDEMMEVLGGIQRKENEKRGRK